MKITVPDTRPGVALFRCRACRAVFRAAEVPEVGGPLLDARWHAATKIHACSDLQFGLADFAGVLADRAAAEGGE